MAQQSDLGKPYPPQSSGAADDHQTCRDDGRGGELKIEPKELKRSPLHYLGGKVIRYDDIPDDDKNSILRSNMRCNDWPLVIENTNSWRFTGAFHEGEVICDADGSIVRRASDADLAEYRTRKLAEFKEQREAETARYQMARSNGNVCQNVVEPRPRLPCVASEESKGSLTPMPTETKTFELRVLLTVTTGRLLTKSQGPRDSGIGDLYALLGWMTNDEPYTHQLPRFAEECKPWLLRWFHELAGAGTEGSMTCLNVLRDNLGSEGVEKWITDAAEIYGLKNDYDVPRIPADDHERKHPFDELVAERGTDEGIVVVKSEVPHAN